MATATAERTQPKANGRALHARWLSIFDKDGFIDKHCVDRREPIWIMGLCVIAGVDPLFLGSPGVGKTWMIELLTNYCLDSSGGSVKLFTHLLAKDQSADEVLGPQSLVARKEDRIARITEGFLPAADFGYLDEIFKSSPPMLNPLLDLFANRVLKVGGEALDCSQLRTIFMSSNELPEREDLQAFRDRIGVTMKIEPVRSPDDRKRVSEIQLGYQARGVDTEGLQPLTLEEIVQIAEEVNQIIVPEPVIDQMTKAQKQWNEALSADEPSTRRVGQMWRMVKAHAWAAGRTEASDDDLLPCQYMAANRMGDDFEKARKVVMELASAGTRKVLRLEEEFEPVLKELEDLKDKINDGDDDKVFASASIALRSLKKMRNAADGLKGATADPKLDSLIERIDGATQWARAEILDA